MSGPVSMSRADYDRIDAVNWSALKHLRRSPAQYRYAQLETPQDTDTLKRGRAIHLAVLEPERFRRECIAWTGGRRYGKEWQAFCAEHKSREILTQEMWDEAVKIGEAARADKWAVPFLKGKTEQTVLWRHEQTGLDAKGRIDLVGDGFLVDLKSTRSAHPAEFGNQAARLGYVEQCAYYRDGFAAATGEKRDFFIVAVEATAPHVVQVFQIGEDLLELGRERYLDLLRTLKECRESNEWPGYGAGPQFLQLPAWAAPAEEEDLGALGLVMDTEAA